MMIKGNMGKSFISRTGTKCCLCEEPFADYSFSWWFEGGTMLLEDYICQACVDRASEEVLRLEYRLIRSGRR